jgi:hypothetical protein
MDDVKLNPGLHDLSADLSVLSVVKKSVGLVASGRLESHNLTNPELS